MFIKTGFVEINHNPKICWFVIIIASTLCIVIFCLFYKVIEVEKYTGT